MVQASSLFYKIVFGSLQVGTNTGPNTEQTHLFEYQTSLVHTYVFGIQLYSEGLKTRLVWFLDSLSEQSDVSELQTSKI